MAKPICFRLLAHWVRLAASRTFCTAGSKSAINTPMIAITTSNSIRVNPNRSRLQAFFIGTFPPFYDGTDQAKIAWARQGPRRMVLISLPEVHPGACSRVPSFWTLHPGSPHEKHRCYIETLCHFFPFARKVLDRPSRWSGHKTAGRGEM